MKKEIMSQAVLAMGYRPLYEGKIYAKPVGFALMVVEFVDEGNIKMSCLFHAYEDNKATVYASKIYTFGEADLEGEELYNKYCYEIAYLEGTTGLDHAVLIEPKSRDTFAFKTGIL